jgi:hypothetical protein
MSEEITFGSIEQEQEYRKMKKYDRLPYRLEFINRLINGNKLQSLVELDITQSIGSS